MKVLLVAPYFNEQHRWMASAQKAAEQLGKDNQVVVFTTGKPRESTLPNGVRIYRVRDFFMPDPVNYSIVPGLIPRLFSVVRRERPDICLVNKHMFFTSFSVPFLRLTGKPVITMVDTFPGMNWHPQNWLVDFVMRIYAWCIGYPLLKLSTKVILLHEGLLPLAKRLGLRAEVIHNGVDVETFTKAEPAMDFSQKLGRVNICYVGRLESVKGVQDLLVAAESILQRHADVRLFLVGDVRRAQKQQARFASTQVHFLGYRDDVASVLKKMDILVLPSYAEGLPNALMEGMALGKACVAAYVGGVQVLVQDGKNGLTFPPGNQMVLKEKLEKLIADESLRFRIGQAAKQTIEEQYNWLHIREQYQHLFRHFVKAT